VSIVVAIALTCYVYYKRPSSSRFSTRLDPAAKSSPPNRSAPRQDESPGER